MFDDAPRTRGTDPDPEPGLVDYVIITALAAIALIASYSLVEDRFAGSLAAADAPEPVFEESVIR